MTATRVGFNTLTRVPFSRACHASPHQRLTASPPSPVYECLTAVATEEHHVAALKNRVPRRAHVSMLELPVYCGSVSKKWYAAFDAPIHKRGEA